MEKVAEDLLSHLVQRLQQVQTDLGFEPAAADAVDDALADQLDSMGLVEFIALIAQDCGTTAAHIEQCTQKQFGTLRQLANALSGAGLHIKETHNDAQAESAAALQHSSLPVVAWLSAPVLQLPAAIQSAEQLDAMLHRPTGWLRQHAGIVQRHVWGEQDPIETAAEAARTCLQQAGLLVEEVDVLLAVSEAPPVLAGLAAVLHQRLGLRPETAALEVGGACTGFLAALWLCQHLLSQKEVIVIIALEAPSRYLLVQPGAAGEAAALFGDGVFACAVSRQPLACAGLPVADVQLQAHGTLAHLLQVAAAPDGNIEIHMMGQELASRAVRTMADNVRDLAHAHDLTVADLQAVIVHGGNGRMPALAARELRLPIERVWSQTAQTGNLGSASLPAAWAAHKTEIDGPLVWSAVGAGLTAAAALTGIVEGAQKGARLPL